MNESSEVKYKKHKDTPRDKYKFHRKKAFEMVKKKINSLHYYIDFLSGLSRQDKEMLKQEIQENFKNREFDYTEL